MSKVKMTQREIASACWSLAQGVSFPFNDEKARDWADAAAHGVLADLSDRRGFRQLMDELDLEVRTGLTAALGNIIRQAHHQMQQGE